MTYYAIALNNDRLSGDWLLNMFFGGLVEIGGSVAYYCCVETAGRRNNYFAMMFITSVTLAVTPIVASGKLKYTLCASMLLSDITFLRP